MKRPTLEEFGAVVASIHEAAAAPEQWPDALSGIMGLFEVPRGGLIDVRLDPLALDGLYGIGHDPEALRQYGEHYFSVDPVRDPALALPPLEAFVSYEIVDEETRAKHEYFDFARRFDLGDVIGTSTQPIGGVRYIVSLQRPWDGEPFDAEAKALMRSLAPHLQQARAVQARLRGAGAPADQLSDLQAGLDRVPAALFIVDQSARIRELNLAATRLLGESTRVLSRLGMLTLVDADLDNRLKAAIARAVIGPVRSCVLELPLGEGRRAEMAIAPLRRRGDARAATQPLALVAVVAPAGDLEAIAARLRELYRLTDAESRVAAHIALGRTVQEIAALHGVKEVTLRTQLRTVFQKTGAARQAELVRLALSGAAQWGGELEGAASTEK